MLIYQVAALGAALCWAITGVLAADGVRQLGALGFNLYRQSFVACVLALILVMLGRLVWVDIDALLPLMISGIIGIFLGDTVLYFALIRLGPRRAGALFALNAPMAAVLGWVFLDEKLGLPAISGVILCAIGVMVAVLGRPGRSGVHRFETIKGPVWQGVILGLLAAAGQAVGSMIARPVMESGFDPMMGSLIRVSVASACLLILFLLPIRWAKPAGPLTRPALVSVVVTGIIAMVVGMTLLLFALQGGKVGIVSTLSAMSPVIVLPVLWAVTGARPSFTSWAGAGLAVAGMGLIFLY